MAIAALIAVGFLIPMPAAVPTGALPSVGPAEAAAERLTEHVVVISVDGLRPDAIEAFGAVEMLRLMGEGRYSLRGETVLPSNTVPAHTSLVTGVEPSAHGVTWNDRASVFSAALTWSDRRRQVPTIFQHASATGLSTASIVAKSQLRQLGARGSLDHHAAPRFPLAHIKREWRAERVVEEVERYLVDRRGRPNLLFVHLADPDLAGHAHGWMSDTYGAAVRTADGAVGRILAAAEHAFGAGGYTVILTADHGGLGDEHGGSDPREVRIPWIMAGRGVEPGGQIDEPVRITDTGATALRLLGVPVPDGWTGRPLAAAPIGAEGSAARP